MQANWTTAHKISHCWDIIPGAPGAWRTIAGYEAMHMIRKGQACWNAAGAKVGLLHRFILDLFAATS